MVMAWCCQATSHYLSQCWPRFTITYRNTGPQWVKTVVSKFSAFNPNFQNSGAIGVNSLGIEVLERTKGCLLGICHSAHYNDIIMNMMASHHQPHDCLLNRLFRRRSKKTSKLHVTGLCAGNSPGTSEFPTQMASNAENVSIWWRHHVSQLWNHSDYRCSPLHKNPCS